MPIASALIKCWPVGGNARKFAIAWGLSACLAMLLLAERAGAAMAADQAPFSPGTELTLKRAIEISLRYHPRRREAQADVDAARQRVGEARAYLMPRSAAMRSTCAPPTTASTAPTTSPCRC